MSLCPPPPLNLVVPSFCKEKAIGSIREYMESENLENLEKEMPSQCERFKQSNIAKIVSQAMNKILEALVLIYVSLNA